VGQAETEQKYVGVSGKRIRCFTHAQKTATLLRLTFVPMNEAKALPWAEALTFLAVAQMALKAHTWPRLKISSIKASPSFLNKFRQRNKYRG